MAIPLHKLKQAIEKHIRISHPPVWTGFLVELKEGRLFVIRISKDGPAEKAGMKVGDEVLRLADREVRSLAEIESTLKNFGPKESVKILVKRDGKEEAMSLVLEEKEFY
jgi:S1-C subfamily serine protease